LQAKLIAFIITQQNSLENAWEPLICEYFGELEHRGKFFPFSKTDYYNAEMGESLYRSVVSFKCLISPENITEYKVKAIEIENTLRNKNGGRIANIDIGYMDQDKIVLPSTKRGPFKLYAGNGFWLDMTLTYAKGDFKPTAWAFADFRENPYKRDLILIREKYKRALAQRVISS
jgi:hypothetical protein